MDSDKKERVIGSIVLIIGSLVGLALSLIIPFPIEKLYTALIILFPIAAIAGVILLILTFIIKLPPYTSAGSSLTAGILGFLGIFDLILSLISPLLFPFFFNVGIFLFINVSFHIWVRLKRKYHK
jgi:hypothetical protein